MGNNLNSVANADFDTGDPQHSPAPPSLPPSPPTAMPLPSPPASLCQSHMPVAVQFILLPNRPQAFICAVLQGSCQVKFRTAPQLSGALEQDWSQFRYVHVFNTVIP